LSPVNTSACQLFTWLSLLWQNCNIKHQDKWAPASAKQ